VVEMRRFELQEWHEFMAFDWWSAGDLRDGCIFKHCAAARYSPIRVRHAVYASQGMSFSEACVFWNDLEDHFLRREDVLLRKVGSLCFPRL